MLLLSVTLSSSAQNLDDEPLTMVDAAGITMTFSEKFYSQYQNSIVDYLTTYLNGMEVQDFSPEFSLGIPKVLLQLRKQKVIYFKMQDEKQGGGADFKIVSKPN